MTVCGLPLLFMTAVVPPLATSRRAIVSVLSCGFTGVALRQPCLAIPPPVGSVSLLLPLVQQRLLLAECSAAIARPDVNWSSLRTLFISAPFTDPRGGSAAVGNLFRSAAAQYEASLIYQTELSGDDRKLCFPRSDSECVRLQRDSDRMYRGLLITEALSALQAVESELDYLSKCERGAPMPAGVRCTPGDDRDEIVACLSAAGAAMDRYFDVVPAEDARAAVEAAARVGRRWEVVPLAEGPSTAAALSSHKRVRTPVMRAAEGGAPEDEPTTATLTRFALPTLAAWLISPLMSLVDTAVVGRSATAVELAALGPATMVSDSSSYLLSFLSVATTNLVATALSQSRSHATLSQPAVGDDFTPAAPDSTGSGGHELAETLDAAVRLALLCGVVSTIVQVSFGRQLLARYTASRSAACIAPAYEYVRIRALGAPAALLTKVGTATCLASKEPLAPLVAVGFSGLLNLVLDALLVSCLGCGISGAAWATVASEVACAMVVFRAVLAKCQVSGGAWSEVRPRLRPLLPSRAAVDTYAAYAKPLLLTLAGKIATYSSLAHVATTVSVAGTAAHRVLMCVYWFAWPFAEVCSQVGQAFLPGVQRVRPLLTKLLVCGLVVGLASGGAAVGVLAWAPQLFTRDTAVMATIRSLAPLVASCIATLAFMSAMEGTLLATRQLGFLSSFYTANAIAMVLAFALVERLSLGLSAAWACMLAFQLLRLAAFGLRLTHPSMRS